MIGDMEKSQRQKQVSTDESNNVNSSETELGGGGGGVGSCKQTNEWNTAITRSGLDEQPQFKKPRLESSCVMTMMKPEFEDGAIILRNCEVRTDGDKGQQQQECSTASVGECSTCGDTGFQSELFRCTKCSVRLQHTYCSNSYNPNKRWFIGLCNWCELDVFRSGATTPLGAAKQISGTPTTITANPQGVTKGRDGTSTSSSLEPALERISRSVSAVAIDSLVGAASRLSDHGLTSLREESPPTAATGTSKGVTSRSSKLLSSFDKIENAKRSGPPSCNGAVKTSHKKSQVSSSGGGGGSVSCDTTSSDGKAERAEVPGAGAVAAAKVTVGGGRVMEGSQEREEKPFVLKRSLHRPRHAVKTVATAAVAAVANGREGNSKENSRETSSTSSDSADAKSTSPSAGKGSGSAGRGESEFKPSFKRSYSMNMIMTKAKKSVAQLVDYDDKSETTVDNTVVRSISSRRSPGRSSPRTAAGVERERESPGEEERRVKKDKYGSTRTTATTSAGAAADCGEKLKAASPTTSTALLQESSTREASGNSIRKTNDRKENGGGGSVRTVAAAVDSKLPGRILNGGCSNGAEVVRERDQFTRHGSGSGRSVIPLRKSQSFRLLQQQQQYSEQSRLVTRPNAMIGKSKVAYPLETPKTPRRFADLKNSKLRRSSSSPRVSGVHFKCLSDILC